MLVKVSGCSGLSTLLCRSRTFSSSSAATSYFPCFEYVCARFAMLVKVSGCSGPSTLLCRSRTFSSSRTPESTLGTQIQKVENFQIFIRTVLGNFYPDGGSGSGFGQILSRHGSGLPQTAIFTFFRFKTPNFRFAAPLEAYHASYKHFVD